MKQRLGTDRIRWVFVCSWYAFLVVAGWSWQKAPPKMVLRVPRIPATVEVVSSQSWRSQAMKDLRESNTFSPLAARDLAAIQAPEALPLLTAYAQGKKKSVSGNLLPISSIYALAHYGDVGRQVLERVASSPEAKDRRLHAVRALEESSLSPSISALQQALRLALEEDDWASVEASRRFLKNLSGKGVAQAMHTGFPVS
jgi:hypothetical protein